MIKVNATIDVPREVLEGIFVTAIEGACNYWCFFEDKAIDIIDKAVPSDGTKSFSERLFEAVYDKGVKVPIHDLEDDEPYAEPIGMLDKETFKERLELCAKESLWALQEEIDEQGDAVSSDAVFQYLALNQLVYG